MELEGLRVKISYSPQILGIDDYVSRVSTKSIRLLALTRLEPLIPKLMHVQSPLKEKHNLTYKLNFKKVIVNSLMPPFKTSKIQLLGLQS